MSQQKLTQEQIEMFDTITSKVMYCELEYIYENYTALMEYKRQKETEKYNVECITTDENGGIKQMVYWDDDEGYDNYDDAITYWKHAIKSGRYDAVRLTNKDGDIVDEWNKESN